MPIVPFEPALRGGAGPHVRVLGLCAGATVLLAGTGNVLGTLIALGVAWSYMLPRRDLERGAASLGRRELNDAERWLRRAVRSPFATRRVRARAHHLRSRIKWLQGDHGGALESCSEAVGCGAGLRVTLEGIQLLAITGRIEGASEALAAVPPPCRSDPLWPEHLHTRLTVAFHADDPRRLPSDLVPWLAAAGAPDRGATAVLMAWAFDQRGDSARAHRLLEEATGRLRPWALAQVDPRLNQFFRSQRMGGYRARA